jgi:integrase
MGVFLKRGKYFIDFYADRKRVRECVGLVSRRDAERALKVRQAEVVQGRYQLQRKVASPRFDAFAADYMEYSRAHKSSRSSAADQTRLLHLLPFFRRYRLNEITRFLVDKFVHQRRQSISRRGIAPAPATINRELECLRHMFNKAIEWKKAEHNPVRGMRFLKEPPAQWRILSREEEEHLIRASASHIRVAILLAANTGLRHGEVLALRKQDIDLKEDILTVVRGKGNKRRKVEINLRLKNALTEYLRTCQNEYLFFNERIGKPYTSLKTGFSAAIRRSGIGHCRFHDLRHLFGTRLVAAGVDLVTVQKLMGHASIETTLRYSHPGARERRRAVDLLSDGHHMDTTRENVVAWNSSKSLKTQHVRL